MDRNTFLWQLYLRVNAHILYSTRRFIAGEKKLSHILALPGQMMKFYEVAAVK